METREALIFWGVLLLICLFALTRSGDWMFVFRKVYYFFVEAFKFQPYADILHDDNKGKKRQHTEIDLTPKTGLDAKGMKGEPFPRSRRST